MTVPPIARIAIALAAATLFLLTLAYWWQGNLFHEVVGLAFIALLTVHNLSIIRWYGALAKGKWTARRSYATAVNLTMLVTISGLFATSVLVSQSLFAFVPFNIGFAARDAHLLTAYWTLIVLALHLGLHWSRVMSAASRALGLSPNAPRTAILRLLAAVVAAFGAHSVMVVMLPEKLVGWPVLEMWDFNANAPGFFLHYGSIVGLFAAGGHYLACWLQSRRRPAVISAAEE